jgi:hypothetical protein
MTLAKCVGQRARCLGGGGNDAPFAEVVRKGFFDELAALNDGGREGGRGLAKLRVGHYDVTDVKSSACVQLEGEGGGLL